MNGSLWCVLPVAGRAIPYIGAMDDVCVSDRQEGPYTALEDTPILGMVAGSSSIYWRLTRLLETAPVRKGAVVSDLFELLLPHTTGGSHTSSASIGLIRTDLVLPWYYRPPCDPGNRREYPRTRRASTFNNVDGLLAIPRDDKLAITDSKRVFLHTIFLRSSRRSYNELVPTSEVSFFDTQSVSM